MAILDRYITRQIWIPALLALSVVCVLAISNEIQERASQMPIDYIRLGDISRLSLFFLPTLVIYVVPIMYMMGILLAFGRLSQRGELIAMKAAGIPLKRIVMPVILVGAILSVLTFVVQDRLQPWAMGQVYSLLHRELPMRITLDVLPTGQMQEFRGWNVYIGSRDSETGILHDVDIIRPDEDGGSWVYSAKTAELAVEQGRSVLRLHHVSGIPPAEKGYVGRMTTEEYAIVLPQLKFDDKADDKDTATLKGLLTKEKNLADEAETTGSRRARHELTRVRNEAASRVAMPFSCLAVSLVAAPLGARSKRSGRSYTFAMGFAIVLVYYVLLMVMEPRSLHSFSTVLFRSMVPNMVLFVWGAVAIWRVDSV